MSRLKDQLALGVDPTGKGGKKRAKEPKSVASSGSTPSPSSAAKVSPGAIIADWGVVVLRTCLYVEN